MAEESGKLQVFGFKNVTVEISLLDEGVVRMIEVDVASFVTQRRVQHFANKIVNQRLEPFLRKRNRTLKTTKDFDTVENFVQRALQLYFNQNSHLFFKRT